MRRSTQTSTVLLLSAGLLVFPSTAFAGDRIVTLDGEYGLFSGHPPGQPYFCSNIMFVRWKSVPNTTAVNLRMGTAEDDDLRTEYGQPPFDNQYVINEKLSWAVDVEPGYDRLKVGQNSGGGVPGSPPADCNPLATRLASWYGNRYPILKVDVTQTVPDARILRYRGVAKLDRAGRAPIARVRCPDGTSCTVAIPKFTRIVLKGKRYKVRVLAPRRVAGGKVKQVRVRLPLAARKGLGKRSVRVGVKVTAVSFGNEVSAYTHRSVRR